MNAVATLRVATLRVAEIDEVARDIRAITFVADEDAALPAWRAGAHVELELPGGLPRHYSLCSDPADAGRWRIAVLREADGGGGSVFMHDRLAVGDRLDATALRDNFGYRPEARAQLFVAGGIGITPLLPMLRAAEALGADWKLLYLGRSLDTMAFRDELALYGDRVVLHPRDTAGRFDLSAGLDELDASLGAPEVYACGPARMLDAVVEWASADPSSVIAPGVADAPSRAERLRVERFEGSGDAGPREGDEAFTVELADGTEVEVGAEESILQAFIRCGIPALNSCREGICGTCETTVVEGVPDHRDQLLSDEERASNETMMICVSRCIGKRLVLDA